MFNQIYITRTDEDGNATSEMRVPITYGPREKVLARVESDPELNRPFGKILPYITFELKNMRYDGDRHKNAQGRRVGRNSNKDLASWVYNPVAIDFFFEMTVLVKHVEDGVKIVEQILPFFTPDWTSTVRLIDDPEIIMDIPVTLVDHRIDDTWEGSYDQNRIISHTFSFTMQGYLFGPKQVSKIIKKSESNVGIAADDVGTMGQVDATIVVTPGLTADGQPTSDPNESLPYSDIAWDEDYGFIVQIQEDDDD